MKLPRAIRDLLGLPSRNGACFSSGAYWTQRYRNGGNSGPGSYNHLAEFKAEILNSLVQEFRISTVMEFGCGDGNQLALARYPDYLGLDVTEEAVRACRERFSDDQSKRFGLVRDHAHERAELCLSLDVIFHLIEDDVFDAYMLQLFSSADRHVVIYSSNTDDARIRTAQHVRHRIFSDWIESRAPEWRFIRMIPNRYPYDGDDSMTSFADFYVYARNGGIQPRDASQKTDSA